MACIKKRRGKWVVDYRDTSGKRHWVTVDGNRDDAEQMMARILGANKRPVNRKASFSEWAEEWLETEAKGRLKLSTYLEFKAAVSNHLTPYFGNKRFHKVSRQDVLNFITKKKDDGLCRSTVKNLIAPLRAMYYDAIVDNGAMFNPAVKLGKHLPDQDTTKIEPNPLNGQEVRHLLDTVRERLPEYYPVMLCAARAGLRLGELIALRWEQIDFHSSFILVNHNFSRGEFTSPKNKKSRKVDMSEQLAYVLRSLLRRRKAEALKSGTGEVLELVFLSPSGSRLDGTTFGKKIFHRALSLAELRKVKFHSLRHSFASLLLKEKGETREGLNFVKDQLGHHSITLTVDTYGHRMDQDNRSAVNSLDDPGWQEKMVAER